MGPEGEEIIPSTTIRPHHLLWNFTVRDALRGNLTSLQRIITAKLDAESLRNKTLQTQDPTGYYADVIGNSATDMETYQEKYKDFLALLTNLPYDSFVHLDIKPDGLCNSCIIGKHCTATNYKSDSGPSGDTVADETRGLMQIFQKLEQSGCELGKDFFVRQTTHTIYDLHGQSLKDAREATPKKVVFNSIVVRTNALRKTLSRGSLTLP